MSGLEITVLLVHYALIGVLCAYGAHRLKLTAIAWKARPIEIARQSENMADLKSTLPRVTVQAPLYNEKFVVKRLIDALASLDYPQDRLQIQIVDDSTDECANIAAATVGLHRSRGVDIVHVRRDDRSGFKAGALQNALQTATGEYIAIFDADFIPDLDFLLNVIPFMMENPEIGMAQARWQHLNTDTNILTRVQSIILDAHFAIEQVARHATGAFFNFNGTAGVWRAKTIQDAGGWRADTLTEDLDLSYRAQTKGWRFAYLRTIGCPSELPTDMRAFKTQQHRWAKGAIEVMKKMLSSLWRSDKPQHVKTEAAFHLTGNFSYLLMLVDSLFFLLPSIHIREQAGLNALAWLDIPLFVLASASHAVFFMTSQKILYGKVLDKLWLMPSLLSVSIGLSVNNGRAVLEAMVGHVTGFVRTPKTGDVSQVRDTPITTGSQKKSYKTMSALWADILELLLAAFYGCYLVWALTKGYWIVTPFLALFAGGFFFTSIGSLSSRLRGNDGPLLLRRQTP